MAVARDFENPASHDSSQQFVSGNVQRQDTPNDPNYDNAEPDTLNQRTSTNLYDERFDLFGFPSALTPEAVYRVGPHAGQPMVSGFNAAGAWKLTRGRPDAVVAILDSGIKWDKAGLRDKIHLNTGELPLPERADASSDPGAPLGGFDLNHDGAVDVDDYANDPRVRAVMAHGQTLVTGLDLIHAFGNCEIANHAIVRCVPGGRFDNDHNGYANDIAGWNFFDNTNDPTDRSSYFSARDHGSGRAENAIEQGNDAQGSIGVCPHCQFIPIRTYDTFVSDANTFALGMLYATDNGAKVIEGANGSVYHSTFAERASQYAYDHGVVQTYSGDDLNTADHNFPAAYNHTMLIQGSVPDTVGLGQNPFARVATSLAGVPLATQAPVGTYFRGAGVTQYGGHSSVVMEGTTGSENTGKAAGAAAMVVSAALDHGIVLRPDETREILEQTAERVFAANSIGLGVADPGADPATAPDKQWTSHFGWGRVDLGAAVAAAANGRIPPESAIYTPDWYAPLTEARVPVTGIARARFAPGGAFHYKLEWAPGADPGGAGWHTVAEGDAGGTVTSLGTLDLNEVRAALASYTPPPDPAGPTFSPSAPNPLADQFTVQLTVTAPGSTLEGIDRKVLDAFSDPTLRPGYPKRMGAGGEAAPRYAELDGDTIPELVVPTEDGHVHAYEPDGTELSGWPVSTQMQSSAVGHLTSPALSVLSAPLEPPRGVAVIDLHRDGRPDVITAAGTHIYAWDAHGRPVGGFPLSEDLSLCGPALESQPDHHPKCGFAATPAIAYLHGRAQGPDIVEPSLDGHLYAWAADGRPVPGYPVALSDPAQPADKRMVTESINDAAVGDLNGSGHDDVVVMSNERYPAVPGNGAGGTTQALIDSAANAAGGSARVYAIDGSTGKLLPGWPVKLNGVAPDALPFVGPGNDAVIATIAGKPTVIVSATTGVIGEFDAAGKELRAVQQNEFGPASNVTDRTLLLNLFESASVGDLLGNGGLAIVKYGISAGKLADLVLAGQNFPYNHAIGAYDAMTGDPLAAWPTITDDFQFLSSSTIAKLVPGQTNQVLAGTGLGLLHAYDGATGRDVAGFPKHTAGWLAQPVALSDDGRLAAITREGYLFEWSTQAGPCQSQWSSFRHDQHGSANYNTDGTPPDAPGALHLAAQGYDRYRLTFSSPGDDGRCGTPAGYIVEADGQKVHPQLGAPVAAGKAVSATLVVPGGTRFVSVQARDAAGNIGPPAVVDLFGGCLRGAPVARSRTIGPVRLGMSQAAVFGRAGSPRVRRGGAIRYCVHGGGALAVAFDLHGRVALIAASSAVRSARLLARSTTLASLRHAYPHARALGAGLWSAGRRGAPLFYIHAGRVRAVLAASGRLRHDRALLLRTLRGALG